MRLKQALRLILPLLVLCSALPAFAASSAAGFEILATFDYPSATDTFADAINDNGDVAGFYYAASGPVRGFVRLSNGRLSRPPIVDPNDSVWLHGINNLKTLCGVYLSFSHDHGFLLSGHTFTEITTDASETLVYGVNDAGNVCGITRHPDAAFVTIAGTPMLFQVPGSSINFAYEINNLDQCVGYYVVGTTRAAGFRRDADGTLTYPISVPGSTNTTLSGINDIGSMVGAMVDATGGHAVFFQPSGMSTVYDYPGATCMSFSGINNKGLICGSYSDTNGSHAFIGRVRPAAGE